MAGLTTTLADAVLKDAYEKPTRDQLNNSNKLVPQVQKNTKDFVGRDAYITMHVGRNTGIGARLEGEVLPVAGNQRHVRQLVPCRSQYGEIRLTAQSIKFMASNRGSFIRATDSEMSGIKRDVGRDMNRQYWGTSNGVIATCGTTTASTTVQLATLTPEQVMVGFKEGSYVVDIGTVANPQLIAANRAITSADITNHTITISGGAVTTSASHFIFRQGAGGTGANQRESTGVQTIIDDTAPLFGIDPAVEFTWASLVDGNSGNLRPVSEGMITKMLMRTGYRSGSTPNLLWCEGGVYRAIGNLLSGMKRIVNTNALRGGYTGLAFDGAGVACSITDDRDAPPNKIYGMSTEDFVEYVNTDWEFEKTDGNILRLATDRTHAFTADWYSFRELSVYRRNSHFRIDDVEGA